MGLLLLLCGVIIGASLTAAFGFNRLMATIHEPETIPPRIVARMKWNLSLTDEQAEQVEAIITDLQRDLVSIRDRNLPEIERELEQARTEVLEVLTPEQGKIYNRGFEKLRDTLVPKVAIKEAP